MKPVSTPVTSDLAVGHLLDVLVDRADERIDRREAGAELPDREFENSLLDILEDVAGGLLGSVAAGHDLVGDLDQAAQGRLFLDDLGIVLDVDRARQSVGEARQVSRAAGPLQIVRPLQLVLQRDEVDRRAGPVDSSDIFS